MLRFYAAENPTKVMGRMATAIRRTLAHRRISRSLFITLLYDVAHSGRCTTDHSSAAAHFTILMTYGLMRSAPGKKTIDGYKSPSAKKVSDKWN